MNNKFNPPSKNHPQKKIFPKQGERTPGKIDLSEKDYYDEIFKKAYEDGYYRGYDAGYNAGYDEGYDDVQHNEQKASMSIQKGLKWHGKKSKSWSWL